MSRKHFIPVCGFYLTRVCSGLFLKSGAGRSEGVRIRDAGSIKTMKRKDLEPDKYIQAIENHFPNTHSDEVSAAEVGRELRSRLSDEQKIASFPTKKELQAILAKTAKEAITQIPFELFTSFNQLKCKSKDYEEVMGFYYVRGRIDPSYLTRYLWLEKLTRKWLKANNLEYQDPIQFNMYSPTNRFFGGKMMRFSSYADLAKQYHARLKYIDEVLIPKHEKLKDISVLNTFLNYSDGEFDSFSGLGRRFQTDTQPILPNPIVAVLAKDQKANEIIEREVLQYLDSAELRSKYVSAFNSLAKGY